MSVTSLELAFFLKAPQPGHVKTRLARAIGEVAACEAYRRMVELAWLRLMHWPRHIFYSPLSARYVMRKWLPGAVSYELQCEGDLGCRLTAGARQLFETVRAPIAFLGGDCPYIDATIIRLAENQLRAYDLVMGPTQDGGYYLLAMKERCDNLFTGISWGGHNVCKDTLKRASESGLSVGLLPVLEDVDDCNSWNRACHAVDGLVLNEKSFQP